MRRQLILLLVALAALPLFAQEHKPYTRNVAIVVYENAEPLDWAGPFEVYNNAANAGSSNDKNAFNVYIVSKTTNPLNAQGLKVVPNYSIANAPKPDIVVFPGGPPEKVYDDPEFFAWVKTAATEAEIVQSVCNGAFILAKAGMLDGLEVTTHHLAIDGLRKIAPTARVEDGRRFVDNGHVVTTAGISAGIDGSLHVVARLLGRRVADEVAAFMEYHWTPEAYLTTQYAYLNPSTDESGRLIQSGDMESAAKNYVEAVRLYREALKDTPRNFEAQLNLARAQRSMNQHAEAAESFHSAAGMTENQSNVASVLYAAAAEYARIDRKDEALAMLGKAFAAGYSNRNAVNDDPAFAALKNDPRLKEIAAAKGE